MLLLSSVLPYAPIEPLIAKPGAVDVRGVPSSAWMKSALSPAGRLPRLIGAPWPVSDPMPRRLADAQENPRRGVSSRDRGIRSVFSPNTSSTAGLYDGVVPGNAASYRSPPWNWSALVAFHSSPIHSAAVVPLLERSKLLRVRLYEAGRLAARSASVW